uniref:Methyltransferase type 11 domain-containing protein n=1 Tax=Chaetoceros debilis TaxID=122233 RepID=A0A7S3PXI9_9STRA
MSVFGRNIIDKLKSKLSSSSTPSFFRFLLPVPPYEDSRYWNKAYESLTSKDVYEWGDFTMDDIRVMKYRHVYMDGIKDFYGDSVVMSKIRVGLEEDPVESEKDEYIILEQPFDEIISVPRSFEAKMEEESEHDDEIADKKIGQQQQLQHKDQSILILGCGNSNLGEEIYHYYHHPHKSSNDIAHSSPITKIVQCDVSNNVVRTMRQRYNLMDDLNVEESIEHATKIDVKHSKKTNGDSDEDRATSSAPNGTHFPHMSIMEADATNLTFDSKFDAIIDKGLVDALFCSTANSSNRQNSEDNSATSTSTDTKNDDDQHNTIHNTNASISTSNTSSSPATASMPPLQSVMMSVHQSLKVGAVFIFFSFSRPEYLFEDTVVHHQQNRNNKNSSNWNFNDIHDGADINTNANTVMDLWSEVNVCELKSIFMYRFVKKDCSAPLVLENDYSSVMPSLHGTRSSRTKSARKKRIR